MKVKLGNQLKQYRKSHGWSVEDVSQKLYKDYGLMISTKTIYGWESDQSLPRTQTFLAMCSLYQIHNLEQLMTPTERPRVFTATKEEQAILLAMRKQPECVNMVKRLLAM